MHKGETLKLGNFAAQTAEKNNAIGTEAAS